MTQQAIRTSPSGPKILVDSVPPFTNLKYVDYGTLVPTDEQDGSVGKPFGTLQAGIDASFTRFYLTGGSINEDVVVTAPGVVLYLTGANASVGLNSLSIPDGAVLIIEDVVLITLTGGINLFIRTNSQIGAATIGDGSILVTSASLGDSTFGDGTFLVTNGPGAVSFAGKVNLLQLSNITMGAGSTLLGTNSVFSLGATVVSDDVELFGCTSAASMTVGALNAQNCALTVGAYTTTATVELQDVKVDAGVSFINNAGQPFNVDGYTNYWLKTNAVALSNPGAKVITEDLTP